MATARTKILTTRVNGRVIEWKGKFGWIQPDAPINHPAAKRGRLYVSFSDIEGGATAIGDHLSFFVYKDDSGLGAMNCKSADGAPEVQKTVGKPEAMRPMASKAQQLVQRESIDDELYSGTLSTWNGSHGWIVPAEQISHPLYKGKIFLSSIDVDRPEVLSEGVVVTFTLYSDKQGLGAQSCAVVDDLDAAAADDRALLKSKPKAGSPVVADGDNTVLKAKPKMGASAPPGPDSSRLQAKPKSSAGTGKPNTIKPPAHFSPEMVERLAAWMWDRGG